MHVKKRDRQLNILIPDLPKGEKKKRKKENIVFLIKTNTNPTGKVSSWEKKARQLLISRRGGDASNADLQLDPSSYNILIKDLSFMQGRQNG